MAEELRRKNNTEYDFIIVGQGIAGSVLAITLINAGYKICIIDKPNLSSSSKIAAGIWNPVVFKRLAKSWLAEKLVPELLSFYELVEQQLHITIIQKRSILKAFTEEQEKIFWQKKANTDNEFLDKNVYENFALSNNYKLQSYSKVLEAGNIDLPTFLEETKKNISNTQHYIEDYFDYTDIIHSGETVTYKNILAKQIIFCDGHLMSQNPYFNWIPLKPAKGETLTISCNHLNLGTSIFNKGFFILPMGNHLYKVGATYEWNELNDTPTEPKKQELITKIESVISQPYQIIEHHAGVRPSTIDRRPVIGQHPEMPNFYVFNGFGTKAVMLAPYFAKQFVNHLKYNSDIDVDVNVQRFL